MRSKFWIPRRMFQRVFWPSVVSGLALSMSDIADSLTIGNRIGERGLAAIGIVTPLFMIYNLIGYGFSSGGCVTHGTLTASGRSDGALRHFRFLLCWILGISTVIAIPGSLLTEAVIALLGVDGGNPELRRLCVDYARPVLASCPIFMLNFMLYDFVRCDDDPGLAALGFSLGCGTDVGLNILLVLILNKGVRGSIAATVIAQTVSVGVLSLHLFNSRGVLKMKQLLRVSGTGAEIRAAARDSLKLGFSTSAQYIFQLLFLSLGNHLLLRAGSLGLIDGDLYVAVFDVVMNVSFVTSSVFQASSGTMQPLASVFAEEHNRESLHYTLRLTLIWGLALGTAMAAALGWCAPSISALFGIRDAESLSVSVPAIRIFCLSAPIAGILNILTGYFQSIGKEKISRLLTLLRGALFLLPSTVIFGRFFPKHYWWLFVVSESATLIAGVVLQLKQRKDRVEQSPVFSAAMDNSNHELKRVLESLETYCKEQRILTSTATKLQLAVEELCLITMKQSFSGKPDEYIQITLFSEAGGDGKEDRGVGYYHLHIRNSAPLFNPFAMETSRIRLDARKELLDSVGVLLVKEQAKTLHYRNYEGFNVLLVII